MLQPKLKAKLRVSLRIKILIIFITALLITLMFPRGESIESDVTIGSVWTHEDLIASTTFEILKDPTVYEKEKLHAARMIQPIFLRDNSIEKVLSDSLKRYNSFFLQQLNKKTTIQNNNTFLSNDSYSVFTKLRTQPNSFSNSKINSLGQLFSLPLKIINEVFQRGLLNLSYKEILRDSISLRDGRYEKVYPKNMFLDNDGMNEYVTSFLKNKIGDNKEINEALEEYVFHFIKPNLISSRQLTEAAVANSKDKVPRNVGIVNENERIIAKHDRITPESKLKINSYRIAKGEETGFWGRFAQGFGKFLHVALILLPFSIYIFLFRKGIFSDNLKIILVVSIFLFVSFLTFLVDQLNVPAPVEYLVLVPVASMLFTIIFDSRIGFYGTVITALIAGALRGNDYVFTLMNIVAGGLSAYTVRDIKNRTQIFRSFLFILIGYVLCIIAFGLERFSSFDEMLLSFAFAGSNALISPVLTYGLIIFFERIFNITTDLTLLELSDFNLPLLKELSKSAPGTFNHSITIGTLAETTAEAIGANPILARVGAYYHDIGKTIDPESFVENQTDVYNVHENLKPEKSVKLIRDHVQKGITLAEENGLPKEILDFIPMHHGTMVISFFYEKAKEIYGEDNVDINDYRYHGPKPNTKETAIVMLADACESTVRSLNDADTQKVENVINNLIDNRIEDGQLDEAPLTFSDVKKIKESFLGILVGHHHKRIRYPNQEELENPKAEE